MFERIPVPVIPKRVEEGRGGTHRRVYTVTHGKQVEREREREREGEKGRERRLSKGRWHGYKPRTNEFIVPTERERKKKKIHF